MPKDNVKKLQDAKVIKKDPLPDEYTQLFEDMSEREAELLISLSAAIQKAEQDSGHSASDCLLPL